MPSESERWKSGPLRNSIGHTEGATGPVTGGVAGHVKSEPRKGHETTARPAADDPEEITGGG